MMKEIDIYEDMKENYPIVEFTGLSEDYLNELTSIILSIQLLNDFPSSIMRIIIKNNTKNILKMLECLFILPNQNF